MKTSEELYEEADSYYTKSMNHFYKAGGSLILHESVAPEGTIRELLDDPETLQSVYESLNSLGFDELTLLGAGVFAALSVTDKVYGMRAEDHALSRENAEMIKQTLEENEDSAGISE